MLNVEKTVTILFANSETAIDVVIRSTACCHVIGIFYDVDGINKPAKFHQNCRLCASTLARNTLLSFRILSRILAEVNRMSLNPRRFRCILQQTERHFRHFGQIKNGSHSEWLDFVGRTYAEL